MTLLLTIGSVDFISLRMGKETVEMVKVYYIVW